MVKGWGRGKVELTEVMMPSFAFLTKPAKVVLAMQVTELWIGLSLTPSRTYDARTHFEHKRLRSLRLNNVGGV